VIVEGVRIGFNILAVDRMRFVDLRRYEELEREKRGRRGFWRRLFGF
jgi:hypothetical protein